MADYAFLNEVENLYKLKSFKNQAEFEQYRTTLFEALSSDMPFAYAMFNDAIIYLIELPVLETDYKRPPTDKLVDFLSSMHLHGVVLEERNTTAKKIINLYGKLYFNSKASL